MMLLRRSLKLSLLAALLLLGACSEPEPEPLPAGPVEASPEPVEAGPAPAAGSLAARFPFPQQVSYTSGALLPDQVSRDEMDARVIAFYEDWKQRYLRDDCGPGRYYVYYGSGPGDERLSVSEGQGYGMIITALMAGYDPQAQMIFDGLLRFYQDHPSAINPALMAWRQMRGCVDESPGNTASALDGDMDIAYALLLADAQWGSQGEIDYFGAALRIIDAIMESEVNPQTMTLMLGDWVSPGDSRFYYGTRSSDFMFGHLRAFEQASGDARWGEVRDSTYAVVEAIHREYSPETGLLPDFIKALDSTPRPADPGFLEGPHDGHYHYNACRTPWRIGVDYLLSGDERDRAILQTLNLWIAAETGGDPALIHAGYHLDGSSDEERAYTDMAFVAPLAVGAMAGPDQAWLNRLWDAVVEAPAEDGGYYDNTLRMLALLALSGNWWEP